MIHCLTPINCQSAQESKSNPNTNTAKLTIYKSVHTKHPSQGHIGLSVHFAFAPPVSQRLAATPTTQRHGTKHPRSERVNIPGLYEVTENGENYFHPLAKPLIEMKVLKGH